MWREAHGALHLLNINQLRRVQINTVPRSDGSNEIFRRLERKAAWRIARPVKKPWSYRLSLHDNLIARLTHPLFL